MLGQPRIVREDGSVFLHFGLAYVEYHIDMTVAAKEFRAAFIHKADTAATATRYFVVN